MIDTNSIDTKSHYRDGSAHNIDELRFILERASSLPLKKLAEGGEASFLAVTATRTFEEW